MLISAKSASIAFAVLLGAVVGAPGEADAWTSTPSVTATAAAVQNPDHSYGAGSTTVAVPFTSLNGTNFETLSTNASSAKVFVNIPTNGSASAQPCMQPNSGSVACESATNYSGSSPINLSSFTNSWKKTGVTSGIESAYINVTITSAPSMGSTASLYGVSVTGT